jgi:RND family efflux transporter MFP subunit
MKKILSGWLLTIIAGLAAGCHNGEAKQPGAVESLRARVVESREQQIPALLRFSGTLHAKESAIISSQVMGRIEDVPVHEGDAVRAGQTLVVLDDAAMRSSLTQAQAAAVAAQNQEAATQSNASLAASTLARYKQLEAEKSVSPQEMDEVTRRAEAAQAQLAAAHAQTEQAHAQTAGAQTMLGYTRLASPFAGVVTARTADPGTMAAPGVPLLQVDRTGALQLQINVDESAIALVHVGGRMQARIDGIAQPATGTVAEVVPAADPASRSFLVKIDLPQSTQLRAGMYGSAEIASGTRAAILVPRSAVVRRGSLDCAYAIDGQGIAQLRYLTLGSVYGDLVEVLSGVGANERLVDAPEERDFTGKQIESQSEAGQ